MHDRFEPIIREPSDLGEYFRRVGVCDRDKNANYVYVSTAIRKAWILSGERIIIKGVVYVPKFKNTQGGVWQTHLVKV